MGETASASVSILVSGTARSTPWRDAYGKAKAAALKRLEIHNSIATAHIMLADTMVHLNCDWTGAERELKRAIELSSTKVTIGYSMLLPPAGIRRGQ